MATKKAAKVSFFESHRYEIADVIERGIKTAIQTAAAAGLLGFAIGGDWAGFRNVALAATAAGVSVVWNAVVAWARS